MKLPMSALLVPLAVAGPFVVALSCTSDESNGSGGSGATGGQTTTSSSTTGSAGQGGSGAIGGGGGTGGAAAGGGGTATGGAGGSGATGGAGGGGGSLPGVLDCSAASGAPGSLTLTSIVGGLSQPVLVKAAPDDPDRLYIVEQTGLVRIYENGQLRAAPFLDVSGRIRTSSEEGLLGLAFHPNYGQNGRFFVHYSASNNGDSTVQEFRRSVADVHVADPNPVALVLQHFTQANNHNGGSIEFGADGFLYVALGDGGPQNDPECDAENTTNLLGKISRLDVDGVVTPSGYPAAPGNPAGAKYYHVGFRNPWRMAFDPCNGDLYIGDVGQNNYEEVDVASSNPPVVRNFGWPYREGLHPHANQNCPANPGPLVDPIAEYDHGFGCAISGGYVYRGSTIPWLRGTYFYADYCSARIWSLHYSGGVADAPVEVAGLSQVPSLVSSFGQDGRGEVYVVDYTGQVLRIDAN